MLVVGDTVIEAPTSPVDHKTIPPQPEAVSWVDVPRQIAAGEADNVGGEGIWFTVIDTEPEGDSQLFKLHVAVKAALAVGETVIDRPISPVDQVTIPAQPADESTVDPPEQITPGAADKEGAVGISLTEIDTEPEGDSQLFSRHKALYEVLVVGATVIVGPVSPVDQFTIPLQPEAVNTVEPPAQMAEGAAESVGAAGIGFTVTATEPAEDTQLPTEHVAV